MLLLDMLVPALTISAFAALGLRLLGDAPPGLRFLIACVGLAAWLVPWPLIALPVTLPGGGAVADWLAGSIVGLSTSAAAATAHTNGPPAAVLPLIGALIALLVAAGVAGFVRDCAAFRSVVSVWQQSSRCGESLRARLPRQLQDTRASIRIVPGTRVAAASGWLRPKIWIGDRFPTAELQHLALVHECWHVRRFDPVWLTVITLVKRVYWWNPVVRWLAGQAHLLMEAACDHRCVRHFGRRRYTRSLASLMLAMEWAASASPRLVPAARNPGMNLARLACARRPKRLSAADGVVLAVLAGSAACVTTWQIAAAAVPPAVGEHVLLPDTPAGRALAALLGAYNGGDRALFDILLGAYTPQEVPPPFPTANGPIELVGVFDSNRLSIAFRMRAGADRAEYIGRLRVADDASSALTHSEVQRVGPLPQASLLP